jgi:hypothetical protein
MARFQAGCELLAFLTEVKLTLFFNSEFMQPIKYTITDCVDKAQKRRNYSTKRRSAPTHDYAHPEKLHQCNTLPLNSHKLMPRSICHWKNHHDAEIVTLPELATLRAGGGSQVRPSFRIASHAGNGRKDPEMTKAGTVPGLGCVENDEGRDSVSLSACVGRAISSPKPCWCPRGSGTAAGTRSRIPGPT